MPHNIYTIHNAVATAVDDNKKYQVHTAKKGEESDTDAFAYPTDASKLLGSSTKAAHGGLVRKVTYDGNFVGTFKTTTAGSQPRIKNSLIKMHLVNSYLHPLANNWSSNWFWGSFDLNKLHNTFEEAAKKVHPCTSPAQTPPITLLKYETEVATTRPDTPMIADFKNAVVEKITTIRNKALRISMHARPIDIDLIKIGEDTIDTFYSKWQGAVGEYGYSSFKVTYSYATGASPALIWSAETTSPESGSKLTNESYLPDIAAASNLDFFAPLFPLAARLKRKPRD
jgi:hypothetical protein